MNNKINDYVNDLFEPYNGAKSVVELKSELISDLNERFSELVQKGKNEQDALSQTLDSIGNIEETLREMSNLSNSLERQVIINFSATALKGSDFIGVTAHKTIFTASDLRNTNFTGADLTGSSFKSSDLQGAIFDKTNLTDCNFTTLDLRNASFKETILVRTNFNKSGLDGAKFTNVKFDKVNFSMTDLRKVSFIDCTFNDSEFMYTDLTKQSFEGMTICNVYFGKACLKDVSFKGSTLQNVSFQPPFAFSKKYYNIIKTINFNSARMDKLSYNALKGLGANTDGIIVV